MKDVIVLRELEQIKAISHPYRIEVLESFEDEQPATAKQIADKMGEPHAKVNYHIKTLVKVGILELVEEKVKSGIVEKYYQPVAKTFVLDKSFMNSGESGVMESLNQATISIFESISKDFYRAVEHANDQDQIKRIQQHNDYYMTLEETKELDDMINEVIEKYLSDKKDKNRENVKPYSVAALILPKIKKKK